MASSHDLERQAEAAYAAMYEASSRHAAKTAYEDAATCFKRAIKAARAMGSDADARRLGERLKHVTAVYNQQFRWVG